MDEIWLVIKLLIVAMPMYALVQAYAKSKVLDGVS